MITMPNKHIVREIIHNSRENCIVESCIGVAYDSGPEQAVAVVRKAVSETPGVCMEKSPLSGLEAFADSSINIGMRYWVKTEALFETQYQVNMAVFKALADHNIEIPFPPRDVHLVTGDHSVAG